MRFVAVWMLALFVLPGSTAFKRKFEPRNSTVFNPMKSSSFRNSQGRFEMMYGDEAHSTVQIATALGISVQRVRQIAYELRKTIREELNGGSDA